MTPDFIQAIGLILAGLCGGLIIWGTQIKRFRVAYYVAVLLLLILSFHLAVRLYP